MKQRWFALVFSAGALLSFYALLAPKPGTTAAQVSLPVSTETGPQGLAGAWRWLHASGIPEASLQERYDRLERQGPAHGNVLLAVVPGRLPIRSGEQAALQRWIERGNTLVILAALDDTPAWSGGQPVNLEAMLTLAQISVTAIETSIGASGSTPGTLRRSMTVPQEQPPVLLEPLGEHALMSGVRDVRVTSDLPASHWKAQTQNPATLAIARRRDDGSAALWVQARGAGQIILCALAAPFGNREIGQADNARLLANIIGWSRSPAGRVWFDDAHQGLVSFYDPQAFFADARLHRSIGWILLWWIVWIIGSQPLRARQTAWTPVDESGLIDASGRFYSRHVPRAAAVRALLAQFFQELRRRLRQSQSAEGESRDDAASWQWLEKQPRVPAALLGRLRDYYRRASADQKVDLARLQNVLVELRGRIE